MGRRVDASGAVFPIDGACGQGCWERQNYSGTGARRNVVELKLEKAVRELVSRWQNALPCCAYETCLGGVHGPAGGPQKRGPSDSCTGGCTGEGRRAAGSGAAVAARAAPVPARVAVNYAWCASSTKTGAVRRKKAGGWAGTDAMHNWCHCDHGRQGCGATRIKPE